MRFGRLRGVLLLPDRWASVGEMRGRRDDRWAYPDWQIVFETALQ